MADYYVELYTNVVDGSNYTSTDRIIIRAGTRDGLRLINFNGNGQYITIMNEKTTPSNKVIISGISGKGCLSISNCKYIDLKGDNDTSFEYGIKVINDNTSQSVGSVWIYGESDHIKLSHLEITCEGITTTGNGIFVQDGSLSNLWTYDTFDIHHNYIHDSRYAGMYLGQNDPLGTDNPYCARFTIHDNIVEDSGTYGMVLKGLNGGPNSYYNNFVNNTGMVSRPEITDNFRTGIRVRTYSSNVDVDVYNNFVINTKGPGILAGQGSHKIYNNIICNAGINNSVDWGHGIVTFLETTGTHIYDNIIIQPTRYGIYNKASAIAGVTMYRNLIGDAGLGEWAEVSPGDTIEGTGADANIYHANVADFGFKIWSDDGDYSNDDFTISPDPCEDVVCDDVCIGTDLYSQVCDPTTGNCITDQLLEANSEACGYDPCEGVVCDDVCIGVDLYSQVCDPTTGNCITDQLLEADAPLCGYIPPEEPPETSIITYVIIGGVSLAILALSARK